MRSFWNPVMLAIAAVSAFTVGACGAGGDDENTCIECNGLGGGAVECYRGFTIEEMCAPDATLAALQCAEAGGTYVVKPVCEPVFDETEGGNGDDGGTEGGDTEGGDTEGIEAWIPGRYVTYDPADDQYVLDFYAVESFRQDASPLLSDSTSLRPNESGYFTVAGEGPLSEALGWQRGDVLLSINGYHLAGFEQVSIAYTELELEVDFSLLIERGDTKVELSYRVE